MTEASNQMDDAGVAGGCRANAEPLGSVEVTEHVRCIQHTHAGRQTHAWCGKEVYRWDKCFMDIDHAAYNGSRGGYLVACAGCVGAITAALRAGGAT